MADEKKDMEFYALKFINVIKDNLNTKITAINTAKNDGLTMDTLNADAYYYMEFGQSLPVHNPICVFQLDLNPADTVAGASSETVEIMVMLIASHKLANSLDVLKLTSRYRRAITEIIEENHQPYHQPQVVSMPDVPFTFKNRHFVAAGVGIRFNYAN
jgi:hypothetical protein